MRRINKTTLKNWGGVSINLEKHKITNVQVNILWRVKKLYSLPNKLGDEIIDLHFSIWSNMVSLYIKIFCPFPFVQ